jgi:hypothetical protein
VPQAPATIPADKVQAAYLERARLHALSKALGLIVQPTVDSWHVPDADLKDSLTGFVVTKKLSASLAEGLVTRKNVANGTAFAYVAVPRKAVTGVMATLDPKQAYCPEREVGQGA